MWSYKNIIVDVKTSKTRDHVNIISAISNKCNSELSITTSNVSHNGSNSHVLQPLVSIITTAAD